MKASKALSQLLRENAHIKNPSQLARRGGVSEQAVRRLLREDKNCQVCTLEGIAKGFNMRLSELIRRIEVINENFNTDNLDTNDRLRD